MPYFCYSRFTHYESVPSESVKHIPSFNYVWYCYCLSAIKIIWKWLWAKHSVYFWSDCVVSQSRGELLFMTLCWDQRSDSAVWQNDFTDSQLSCRACLQGVFGMSNRLSCSPLAMNIHEGLFTSQNTSFTGAAERCAATEGRHGLGERSPECPLQVSPLTGAVIPLLWAHLHRQTNRGCCSALCQNKGHPARWVTAPLQR